MVCTICYDMCIHICTYYGVEYMVYIVYGIYSWRLRVVETQAKTVGINHV